MRSFLFVLSIILSISLVGCGIPEEPIVTSSSTTSTTTTDNATSAPATPTGVLVTASDSQVSVTWNAVTDASSYTLYYSTSSLASSVASATTLSSLTTTSRTVTGLTNGQEVFIRVSAVNSVGTSTPSTQVSATPAVPSTVPNAPTNLALTPGDTELSANWNTVSDATTYNLYHATESFSGLTDIANYATLTGGTLISGLTANSRTITGLVNGTTYYVVVTAENSVGESEMSGEANSTLSDIIVDLSGAKELNDTGVKFSTYYSSTSNAFRQDVNCSRGVIFAQQDCSSGRDVTNNDALDGIAGFSFTKLDSSGNALPVSASDWDCIQDNVTGLIWQVKNSANSGDLHQANDVYNWYEPTLQGSGVSAGTANFYGDVCFGYNASDASTYCNTSAYTARVNAAGLCGFTSGWRLPASTELLSIAYYASTSTSANQVSIDESFFPNTGQAYHYWTRAPFYDPNSDNLAWAVTFRDPMPDNTRNAGRLASKSKSESAGIRLVHSGN